MCPLTYGMLISMCRWTRKSGNTSSLWWIGKSTSSRVSLLSWQHCPGNLRRWSTSHAVAQAEGHQIACLSQWLADWHNFLAPQTTYIDSMWITRSGLGMVYTFLPLKMIPSVLAEIRQSPRLTVIFIALYQMAASWMPNFLPLSWAPPFPMEDQPSNLQAWKPWKVYSGNWVTTGTSQSWWLQHYISHPSVCMKITGRDSHSIVSGRNSMFWMHDLCSFATIWSPCLFNCISAQTLEIWPGHRSPRQNFAPWN